MSHRKALILLSFVIACCSLPTCYASGESIPSVDFELSAVSKYVWRGLVFNEDPVIQPSLTASWESGVSFNLWGNFDTTDFCGTKNRCNELDYTLGYEWESGGKGLGIAYAAYTYPSTSFAGTSEVSASCDFGGEFGANICLNWDVVEAKGLYVNLGWAKTACLGGMSVDLSGGFGVASRRHSEYYYGAPISGLTDATVCLEVPIEAHGGWSVIPSITYASVLKRSLRQAVEHPDNYVFGVTVAKTL